MINLFLKQKNKILKIPQVFPWGLFSYFTPSETSAKKRSAELICAYTLASPLKHHLSTVESGAVITCCYDTKSQKQPRLYPELRCEWCVFCKPKKSIHWVAQKTNSSTSFGVSSSSLWLSEHSFFWCNNYIREKESSTEIQLQTTNFADIAQRKVKYFCLYSFAWKTGLKYSLLAVNSPSLPVKPQLTMLVS